MTEEELRAEIESEVVAVIPELESEPSTIGIKTTIDLHVVYTTDTDGNLAENSQRIIVLNRGTPEESASRAGRRYKNYEAPSTFDPTSFFLANKAPLIALVQSQGCIDLADVATVGLSETGHLIVQLLAANDDILLKDNRRGTEVDHYLAIIPDPTNPSGLILQRHRPKGV